MGHNFNCRNRTEEPFSIILLSRHFAGDSRKINIRVHKLERHSSERIMRQVLSNLITVIRCQPAIQYDTSSSLFAPVNHMDLSYSIRVAYQV